MQRLKEPLHVDRGFESGDSSDGAFARCRLPQKWTLTQPRNLRPFGEFGGCLVRERTATFCGAARRCDCAPPTPSILPLTGTISGTNRTRSGVP